MRSFFLLAVWATLLPQISEAQTKATVIKIGSWNIENLGLRKHGQSPPALAEHLFLAGVDVLALQEIHDTDGNAATRTNAKLDDTFKVLKEQYGQDWQYLLFSNSDPKGTERLCGVAWNTSRVSLVEKPFAIPVVDEDPTDDFRLWDRTPQAIKFSAGKGKTDFVLVPLHLKSNTKGEDFAGKQRELEAEAFVKVLGQVKKHFRDDDIVFLGDTNCVHAKEKCLAILAGAGLEDLNGDDFITYRKGKFASPFDRIIIPTGQSEFKFTRQYALAPTDAMRHLNSLSDHMLVMAAMRVLDDDD